MTGKELYELWCADAGSDAKAYWALMNPADKRAWDKLATLVELK
jgi:hypothetical protein